MSAKESAPDEDTVIVEPEEVFQCLQQGSLINVTLVRALVNYSHPGPTHRLIPLHNNSDHSGRVCWMQFTSLSLRRELIVDWFYQTCTLDNYVSVHAFQESSLSSAWRGIQWTGCEYEEDPISAHYMTSVNTIYIGVHVYHTDRPYYLSFGVRAGIELSSRSSVGGKDLEIHPLSTYSGKAIIHEG